MNLFIKRNFILFLLAGILLGFVFSRFFYPVSLSIIPLLGGLMLSSFLSMDYHLFLQRIKRPRDFLIVFLIVKLILPAVLFYAVRPFHELLAVGILLITAAPAAAVSPALTTLCRGDSEFILVVLIFTTLLSPVSLPFTMNLLAGTNMEMDIQGMIRTLLQIIIIPLGLALLLKGIFKRGIRKVKPYLSSLSIVILTVLLIGLTAQGADSIRENLHLLPLYGGSALLLGIFLALAGYFLFPFFDRGRRIGLSVSTLYINVGLVIVLAARYFPMEVMILALFFEIPVNLFPGIIRKIFGERIRKG